MKPIECENCGANDFFQQDDAYICAYCNSRFPNPAARANSEVHFNDLYAPEPEPYSPPQAAPTPVQTGTEKNRTIALLLCLIFGVYGAHKFYEGKIGMGFLYFFTGGLFGIGWFVDLITLFLFRTNPYYV